MADVIYSVHLNMYCLIHMQNMRIYLKDIQDTEKEYLYLVECVGDPCGNIIEEAVNPYAL